VLPEHDGQRMRVVIASRTYGTSIEDLWNALTNPRRIRRWFGPVSGDFRAGGRFQFEGDAACQVTRCEAPRILAFTWEYGDSLSSVTVTLARGLTGTRLELEHTISADEHWKQLGPGAMGVGWDLAMTRLAHHVTIHCQKADSAGAANSRRVLGGPQEATLPRA
jgi:uncharacterized protein YndB with AHSA1/START domain